MNGQYRKIGMHGFSCSECGKPLSPDDQVAACPDCGAVICRVCCEDGAMDSHECEPDDF